jgi:cell wall-associated NlpC family hydrolase
MSWNLRVLAEKVAWQFVGLPYRWGGDDPMTGFDCSGLCIEVLKSVGVLPRSGDWTAQGLYDMWKDLGHLRNAKSGCLVFWKNKDKSRIVHVEYCIGKGTTIGASGGGSRTTSESAASAQNAYVKVRPIRTPYHAILDPFQELEP